MLQSVLFPRRKSFRGNDTIILNHHIHSGPLVSMMLNHPCRTSVSLILSGVEWDELSVVAADPLIHAILQPAFQNESFPDGFVLSLCRP